MKSISAVHRQTEADAALPQSPPKRLQISLAFESRRADSGGHPGLHASQKPSFKDLGTTPLVRQLGLVAEQTFGHWCSRCSGIWFGHCLEAECPVCGNRNG